MGKNIFNSIQLTRPQSNVFDLSHDVKLSFNMGELVPIMCTECVPGDKFSIAVESMIRLAPMVAPPQHIVNASMHYFFVPNRLVWEHWDDYISNTANPDTDLPYAFPTIEINTHTQTKLTDYMGIPPTDQEEPEVVSAIPFAAYQKIYTDYYRDQNLIEEDTLSWKLTDGSNDATDRRGILDIRNRCWEHDYFTAALPWAQKGDAATIPLGSVGLNPLLPRNETQFVDRITGVPIQNATIETDAQGDVIADTGAGTLETVYDPQGTLVVEPTTINSLRRAYRLQEFFEKMARGGSRVKEVIWNFFGVRTSDARLNRPEYISGTKTGVVFSEVQNTTGTEDAPQGTLAGHGIAVDQSRKGSKFCEEHGYIIGILSVMPKTAYMQGIPKHFIKTNDYTEFFWGPFANLGEMPIRNRELYAFQGTTPGNGVFGYIPQYSEYKFENSRVAGDYRDNLDFWHMARKFASPPALNGTFVTADPTHRIFAVTDPDVQKLYAHVYNKVKAVRLMPKYGTPSF